MDNPLLLVMACILLCTVVRLALRRRRSRLALPPAPPADELPPAVVQLLLGEGKLPTGAIVAVALDLAAAGRLRTARSESGGLVVAAVEGACDGPLRECERLLLRQVEQRQGGSEWMPASALGPDKEDFGSWWQEFEADVRSEAVALGVLWPKPDRVEKAAESSALGLTGLALVYLYYRIGMPLVLDVLLAVLSLIFLYIPIDHGTASPALPEPGRKAAEWWRTAGTESRASEPTADVPTADVPAPAVETLPENQAWSSFGGRWRVVEVGAPPVPPFWGEPGALVMLAIPAVVPAIILGAAIGPVAAAIPVALFAVLFGFWVPAYRRICALPECEAFDAVVVRRWTGIHRAAQSQTTTVYYCAFDDGERAQAWSFKVDRQQWAQVAVGDRVRVVYSPRWRNLRGLITPGSSQI
ncbi:DUF2207 domain-containing protein [Kitasatospora aureofaciens]|uniref:DUF2207 domain-containing protein n=1 Tax=Kitasatospora aureofaciens TaxID=1894 RepID=UPI001C4612E5|nr:DUF2207 domain-containing protein [Kitasatospora aureofaciens]MBV6696807.1 DUF2207 domain-containing protein [Kitasatospora aureofaciens]